MRAAAILIALLTVSVSACDFQQVRIGSIPKPGTARLVYGLDPRNGPTSVALEYEVPDGGSCAPIAKASNSDGASEVEYFAFDVVAGAYSVSVFHTTGSLSKDQPRTFAVPADSQSYLGTFRRESDASTPGGFAVPGSLSIVRNVEIARIALGEEGKTLDLAKPLTGHDTSTPLCSL